MSVRLFARSTILIVCVSAAFFTFSPSTDSNQAQQPKSEDYYLYDKADKTIKASMLEDREYYDPCVVNINNELWMAWLHFVPGEGDYIWIGLREGDSWKIKERVIHKPAKYANPALIVDNSDRLWLSYEKLNEDGEQWDIFILQRISKERYSRPVRVSPGDGSDINHRIAVSPDGSLWTVWQSDNDGQYDIMARQVRIDNDDVQLGKTNKVSISPTGDWHPAVSITPDGSVFVVWDGYDGGSFNVMARWFVDVRWKPVIVIAGGPAFQGRAHAVSNGDGQTWVLWEEGSENWGKPYRSLDRYWNNFTDTTGPLHKFRKLHLAVLNPGGEIRFPAQKFPMPSFISAYNRKDMRKGIKETGAYYERGMLTIDKAGRLWVVYRHFYEPQIGLDEEMVHHIELGWRLFARCLDGGNWSPLYAFDIHQRDGLQRLSITPTLSGISAVWTTGRTDRRDDPEPRGIAVASLDYTAGTDEKKKIEISSQFNAKPAAAANLSRSKKQAELGGREYSLFYGDLHRHTDLSLCMPFVDGSIDDAYRYAIDVAGLDFLGITDHTRDISHGDALSQLWWRCTKEVTRHRLKDTFFPYFSYERSHQDTDHNVISLRDDMLRNFPPPLPSFWNEIGHNTFTIPHAPVIGNIWKYHDDVKRPLMEIYQGCRDYDSQGPAQEGLNKGYRFGFIASSDHLSTAASYACVWAPEASRESVFRSMQARRTFGATDKIRLVFRSGDHWMGERITISAVPEFQIEIDGTKPIAWIDFYLDGNKTERFTPPNNENSYRTAYHPAELSKGEHYFYVHMKQVDRNQAWSSPLWVNMK